MNRKLATLGLFMSLVLHSGLFLLPSGISFTPGLTRLRVTLQPMSELPAVKEHSKVLPEMPKQATKHQPERRPVHPAPLKKKPVQKRLVDSPMPPSRPVPASRSAPAKPAPEPVPETEVVMATAEQTAASDAHSQSAPSLPVAAGPNSSAGTPAGSSSTPAPQSGQTTPLVYLDTPHSYPPLAKQRGWEGTVSLEVLIGRQGQVKEVKLRQSSGYPILDRAALKQVRRWRFQPASVDGKPVEISALVPVVFVLE
jgi:periplasmic protein TonB